MQAKKRGLLNPFSVGGGAFFKGEVEGWVFSFGTCLRIRRVIIKSLNLSSFLASVVFFHFPLMASLDRKISFFFTLFSKQLFVLAYWIIQGNRLAAPVKVCGHWNKNIKRKAENLFFFTFFLQKSSYLKKYTFHSH